MSMFFCIGVVTNAWNFYVHRMTSCVMSIAMIESVSSVYTGGYSSSVDFNYYI